MVLSLRRILQIGFTALALGAIAAATAILATAVQPVQYRSTSILLIPGAGTRADNEAVVRSLEALLVSPPVATDIAQRAGVSMTPAQVIARTTVTRPPDSAVLEVSVLDQDEDQSRALAREAGPALVARINALSQIPAGQLPAMEEYAVIPVDGEPETEVLEPPRSRNGVIGLGLGLLLGAGLAAWRPRRARITSEAEAREAFNTPVYATLPILGSGSWRDDSLNVAEGLLPVGWPPAARRLVVLGVGGRPSVRLVQLLASATARSGRDVLLIDAEPEERGLTAAFDEVGKPGFVDCLSGRADPASPSVLVDVEQLPREMSELVPPDGGRISLLPAGDLDVAPAVLAGSRVTQVLKGVPARDTIIVHAPRLPGPFPANQFVEFADAVVVVAVAGRTRVEEAQSVSRLVMSLTSAPMYAVLLTGGPRAWAARVGGRRVNGHRRMGGRSAEPPSVTTSTKT